MKKTILTLCTILLIFTGIFYFLSYTNRDRVEQDIRGDLDQLTKSGSGMTTFVWFKKKIAYSIYDDKSM